MSHYKKLREVIAICLSPCLFLYKGTFILEKPELLARTVIDHTLTWKAHIDNVVKRANQRLNALKILGCRKFGAKTQPLKVLYQGGIRPLFEYGIPVVDGISKTNIKKLQIIQN